MTMPDPGERLRAVRATIAAEGARMPQVDHNGHPVDTSAPAGQDPTREGEPR
jgi:hypothetical protein